MVKSDSLKATRITIRRACEDDLAQIRNLVLDGLYEIYPLAWRRTFLPSLICQVPSICVASTACATIPSTWVSLRLLAFVAAYGTAMLAWYIAGSVFDKCKVLPDEMSELYDSATFKATYLIQSETNFWVAETELTADEGGEIVGTVGVHAARQIFQHLLKPRSSMRPLELRVSKPDERAAITFDIAFQNNRQDFLPGRLKADSGYKIWLSYPSYCFLPVVLYAVFYETFTCIPFGNAP